MVSDRTESTLARYHFQRILEAIRNPRKTGTHDTFLFGPMPFYGAEGFDWTSRRSGTARESG